MPLLFKGELLELPLGAMSSCAARIRTFGEVARNISSGSVDALPQALFPRRPETDLLCRSTLASRCGSTFEDAALVLRSREVAWRLAESERERGAGEVERSPSALRGLSTERLAVRCLVAELLLDVPREWARCSGGQPSSNVAGLVWHFGGGAPRLDRSLGALPGSHRS